MGGAADGPPVRQLTRRWSRLTTMARRAWGPGPHGAKAFLQHKFPSLNTRVPAASEQQPEAGGMRRLVEVVRPRRRRKPLTWYGVLATIIPFFGWIRSYKWRRDLLADLLAGVSVGCMVIPQGMAYANMAMLPQHFGLYSAFVPTLVYGVLGSSRQLSVGPVSVTSSLLGDALDGMFPGLSDSNPNDPADPALQEQANRAAIQITWMVGVMYTAIALLRMGWIVNFLSHPVVSGFSTGAAIVIALGQAKNILGLTIPRAHGVVEQLQLIFDNLDQFNWRDFSMGMAFIFLLAAMKAASGAHPRLRLLRALGPITVCTISIALMNIFKWYAEPTEEDPYIPDIGTIHGGLPPVTLAWWGPLADGGRQAVTAVLITFLDICESMSVAKALAQKHKYDLAPNQEMRAVGLSNLAGAAFSAYTTTGSFSRSAVASAVGAATQVAGLVAALVVLLTLLVLTPVFEHMSRNVQGAVVIVGVLGMMEFEEAAKLWAINKVDFVVWNVAWLLTMFLGVMFGVGVAVALTLLLLVYHAAFPNVAALGRVPGTEMYRSTALYGDATEVPGMLLVRVDAPLFFANKDHVKDFIKERMDDRREELAEAAAAADDGRSRGAPLPPEALAEAGLAGPGSAASLGRLGSADSSCLKDDEWGGSSPGSAGGGGAPPPVPIQAVVLDLSAASYLDASAIHFLEDLVEYLEGEGAQLWLSNPNSRALAQLRRAGVERRVGAGHIHASTAECVTHATHRMARARQLAEIEAEAEAQRRVRRSATVAEEIEGSEGEPPA